MGSLGTVSSYPAMMRCVGRSRSASWPSSARASVCHLRLERWFQIHFLSSFSVALVESHIGSEPPCADAGWRARTRHSGCVPSLYKRRRPIVQGRSRRSLLVRCLAILEPLPPRPPRAGGTLTGVNPLPRRHPPPRERDVGRRACSRKEVCARDSVVVESLAQTQRARAGPAYRRGVPLPGRDRLGHRTRMPTVGAGGDAVHDTIGSIPTE